MRDSACTSWLITWCKNNENAYIKIFLDSVKAAKDRGRKKKQSGRSKETYYLQLVDSIFNPKAFIILIQTQFGILKKKYNKVNVILKQTGARMMFDDLQKDPERKTLFNLQQDKFPWWLKLHDPGKDFKSAALQHFNVSGSMDTQVSDENKLDEEENILGLSKIMNIMLALSLQLKKLPWMI
ncbi:hypothetical protein F4604DRAFT_1680594 [Suillus subluteus]|nr:hypothetical protein F4604DRAFT_1680594 [Suillus subluteus]